MNGLRLFQRRTILGTAIALLLAVGFSAQPFAGEAEKTPRGKPSSSDPAADGPERVSLDVARDRAKLMHEIYSATLDVMHHRYFRGDKAVVPARAMEDVFKEIKRTSSAEAQWIAVNTKAMSIDHEPKSDFEKKAAKAIAAGKSELEVVEGGYYRRAGSISLTGGCINCHVGLFNEGTSGRRFAGLIISVPVADAPTASR